MKIKTSELIGAALDWAVAKAQGYSLSTLDLLYDIKEYTKYKPSSDWGFGGPIVEEQRIYVKPNSSNEEWRSYVLIGGGGIAWAYFGPTPLIAAMRCYVASKLGADVDVPEELM